MKKLFHPWRDVIWRFILFTQASEPNVDIENDLLCMEWTLFIETTMCVEFELNVFFQFGGRVECVSNMAKQEYWKQQLPLDFNISVIDTLN